MRYNGTRRDIHFVAAEARLEAEYIRRFLGQLSTLEESRLCELKYGLQYTLKVCNHSKLCRYHFRNIMSHVGNLIF